MSWERFSTSLCTSCVICAKSILLPVAMLVLSASFTTHPSFGSGEAIGSSHACHWEVRSACQKCQLPFGEPRRIPSSVDRSGVWASTSTVAAALCQPSVHFSVGDSVLNCVDICPVAPICPNEQMPSPEPSPESRPRWELRGAAALVTARPSWDDKTALLDITFRKRGSAGVLFRGHNRNQFAIFLRSVYASL